MTCGEEHRPLRVLVTAAGSGVGQVIASRFHEWGAQVAACDVDGEGIRALVGRCDGIMGLEGDAADEAASGWMAADAINHLRGIDVLVNNLGIAGPTSPVELVTLSDWNELLRVNLTSHFLFARAVVPAMKAQGAGLIVNISSASARVGLPLRLPYVVSKGALLSMTTNLARELGPFGIRANAILPGAVKGDRVERVIAAKAEALGVDPADYRRSLLRHVSMRTMVEPDDIAGTIRFLASPEGCRITGQHLSVDGNLEWEE